jgi:hypothetical protein
MTQRLFRHSVNYGLVLLLLSLLVYTSIGLSLTAYPVSAESLPTTEESIVIITGSRPTTISGSGVLQIVP